MNDVDNYRAFKVANYHAFIMSLNHLSFYYLCCGPNGWVNTHLITNPQLPTNFAANKEQIADQLKLALAWDRIDVTQSDIFTDDMRWEVSESP